MKPIDADANSNNNPQACVLPIFFWALRDELRSCVQYLTDMLAGTICVGIFIVCVRTESFVQNYQVR